MWGSSFADFAKKAQELQDQAAEAANQFSHIEAPTSLFNLDSMMGEEEEKEKQQQQQQQQSTASRSYERQPPQPASAAQPPSFNSTNAFAGLSLTGAAAAPVARPSNIPAGALKLPAPKKSSSSTAAAAAAEEEKSAAQEQESRPQQPQTGETATAEATDDAEKSDSAQAEEGAGGWGEDEEDLDLGEDDDDDDAKADEISGDRNDKPTAESADAREQQPPPPAVMADEESTSHHHDEHATESNNDQQQPSSEEEATPSNLPETVNNEKAATEEIMSNAEAETEQQAISGLVVEAEHSEVMERSIHAAPPVVEATQQQQQSTEPEEAPDHSSPIAAVVATEDSAPPSPERAPVTTTTATTSHAEPSTPVPPSKTKLLLLVSSSSINRQVKVRQDLAETALGAASIDFESLDGALFENKALRDELFEVSGLRGEYPQFFLVDLSNGGTRFWGDWTRFQHANDDKLLQQEFGSSSSSISAETPTPTKPASMAVPEEVLEHFSDQIKRIEENYQTERTEMEQRHARELREASNHEACQAAQLELETRFMAQIETKDAQLLELSRRNEGYRLKLDMLKREVQGTQELLQARDGDVGKANEKYVRDLRAMEKKLIEAEKKAEQSHQDAQTLQETLNATREDLVASKHEHADLKERVKTVAGELKDRRAECRELRSRIDELMEENRSLQHSVDSLRETLNHQGMNQTEKDSELEDLRKKLADAARGNETVEKEWKEREAKSKQDLVEYKKKAQNSLAMANSRTAAAVQAREEAELDARAARTTADSAFDRATKAEIASREAVAEAKASVKVMEHERDRAVSDLKSAEVTLKSNKEQLESLQRRLEDAVAAKDNTVAMLQDLRLDLEREQGKVAASEQKLRDAVKLADSMRTEMASLKDQLQRARAKAEAAEQKEEKDDSPAYTAASITDKETDDAAVAHLQQELKEANEAIEELKESLKNAVAMNKENGHSEPASSNLDGSHRSEASATATAANGGNETIPLFYAMEKQAELKTARNEMNRLASVLSDVETQKTEAIEAMEEMRRRMEDAEARLRRFEKLGGSADSGPASSSRKNNGGAKSKSGAAVNIEYLKNVMLSFLNAKTVEEKTKLVHVIGMVLELTPEELNSAVQSLQHKGSITGTLFGWS